MPIAAASNPIWVMNSFSTGSQSRRFCNPTPIASGRSRRPTAAAWSGRLTVSSRTIVVMAAPSPAGGVAMLGNDP